MKSSKNAQGKTMPESDGKGRQGVGGNGNLRPVRDGNERSRGRKAGVPNKTTRILKETILQAARSSVSLSVGPPSSSRRTRLCARFAAAPSGKSRPATRI
jgi:hypothetical protein